MWPRTSSAGLGGCELCWRGARDGPRDAVRSGVIPSEGAGGAPVFRAWEKETGEVVWRTDLPGVQTGLPMAYRLNGRPYIVVPVTPEDGTPELVALTLPAGG